MRKGKGEGRPSTCLFARASDEGLQTKVPGIVALLKVRPTIEKTDGEEDVCGCCKEASRSRLLSRPPMHDIRHLHVLKSREFEWETRIICPPGPSPVKALDQGVSLRPHGSATA